MDSLTIVASVIDILNFMDNIYRDVIFVLELAQDPKIDRLYVRLLTEKARFAEWKRNM